MTKQEVAVRVALPLLTIAILAALIWQPAVIWFHIDRLRGDEVSARPAMSDAAGLGPKVQAPLIDAIYAYAPEPGVGFFRPAAFGVLATLREEHVRRRGVLFVLPDEEAIDAMVFAYENEPSAAYRQVMRQALFRVDESTHFVFWGRTATGPYPIEGIPDAHVICGLSFCGELDSTESLLPQLALQWCEHVGSVLRVWLADDSAPYAIDDWRLLRLLDQRCFGEDSATAAALRARPAELDSTEFVDVLNHAYTHHAGQAAMLSALIDASDECDWQRRLHRGLEIRRPHVGETREILRRWVLAIDDACLAELFEDSAPGERRLQMRRSLGIGE